MLFIYHILKTRKYVLPMLQSKTQSVKQAILLMAQNVDG